METKVDITDKIEFGDVDGEHLEIKKCVCGNEFPNRDFWISIYEDLADLCPVCGLRMIFTSNVKIYELKGIN